jgi:Fur family transcriptional regulator, zinc uptake regulator
MAKLTKKRRSRKALHCASEEHEALEAAALLCRQRCKELTSLRRATLKILLTAERPLGAYDLLRRMQTALRHRFNPPTIYRALEFLERQGLISRIESRSAYLANKRPDRSHPPAFFLCDQCNASIEIESDILREALSKNATVLGFRISKHVIECEGTCARCLGGAEPC